MNPIAKDDFREEAEKHWFFIEKLLNSQCSEKIVLDKVSIETTHYLYVEAMIHGYKHAKEDLHK